MKRIERKHLFLIIAIVFCGALNAQVGINTENPQGMFHIDGQGNTNGNTNISDDVVVTATGNVGVGTNTPATKVDIRTSTVNTGFRLQDGSQGTGMVLTSDANGNGKWAAPGFSEFTRVQPASLPFSYTGVTILKNSNGTPYAIQLPSTGTYSLTLGARIVFSNLNVNTVITYVIMQLLPANNASLWNASTPRFAGSYEVYGVKTRDNVPDWRFYLSENITTSSGTGNTVYIAIQIGGSNLPSPIEGTFTIGSDPSCVQCTGGSYVRIN